MKTRLLNKWFVGLTVGLLLAVSALGWAGPPWGKGGIPAALKACEKALKASEAELESCLEQQGFTFPGDGQTGAVLSYTDNGDGTFTDDNTGLMWEIKLAQDDPACGAANQMNRDVHCVNNLYHPFGQTFLSELNGELTGQPFAGHDDWRLPTIKELGSLVDYGNEYGPTMAEGLPGATAASHYASSTYQRGTYHWCDFWAMDFSYGLIDVMDCFISREDLHLRAVRGGW